MAERLELQQLEVQIFSVILQQTIEVTILVRQFGLGKNQLHYFLIDYSYYD